MMLALVGFAAFDAWAGAGLISASIGDSPQQTQEGPTLEQVAQATLGMKTTTSGISIAGNPISGTAAAAAGTANVPGNAADAHKGVLPAPPLDSAKLPVSVIRPLYKPSTNPVGATTSGAPALVTPTLPSLKPAGREPRPASAPSKSATPTGPSNLPDPRVRVNTSSAPRQEAGTKTVAETAPEEPVDTSSSSIIFYTGNGLAAVVLLLSIAAFVRGNKHEAI